MNVPDVYTKSRKLGFMDEPHLNTWSIGRWLRDKHGLLVVVDMSATGSYEFHITFMDNPSTSYGIAQSYDSYQEALEAAVDTAMDFII